MKDKGVVSVYLRDTDETQSIVFEHLSTGDCARVAIFIRDMLKNKKASK